MFSKKDTADTGVKGNKPHFLPLSQTLPRTISPIIPKLSNIATAYNYNNKLKKEPTIATAIATIATDDNGNGDGDGDEEIKYANEQTPHSQIFTAIYEEKRLGNDGSPYYNGSSGTGCSYEYNEAEFVPFLRKFIIDNQIKTVVDLGCGNLAYNRKLYGEVGVTAYHGYDVYARVQEHNRRFSNHKKYRFYTMDFLVHRNEIVPADLCIIKDVLQHWLLADITTLLDYLVESKKFKYIMLINCYPQPPADWCGDMHGEWAGFKTGDWRKISCKYAPLSKYLPKPIFYYKTKEVSIIQCYLFSKSATPIDRAIARAVSPGLRQLQQRTPPPPLQNT
jgi:hypothetical protein